MVERVEVGRRVVQLRVIPGRECVYRERGGGRRGGKIGIQLDGLNSIEHCVVCQVTRGAGRPVVMYYWLPRGMIYCRVHGYAVVYIRVSA